MRRVLSFILDVIDWFNTQMGLLAGIIILIQLIAVLYSVVARYIFHNPPLWGVELPSYLLVAAGFLGGAYTLLDEGHVRVDILYLRWSPRTRAILEIIISLLALFYITFLIRESWLLAHHSLVNNMRSASALRWPLFPSQIMVTIGSGLLWLQLVVRIIRAVIYLKSPDSPLGRKLHCLFSKI